MDNPPLVLKRTVRIMNRKFFICLHKQAADIDLKIIKDSLVIITGVAALPKGRDIFLKAKIVFQFKINAV